DLQDGRGVGADAEEHRMAERGLAGEAARDVPRLTDEGGEEHQHADRDQVVRCQQRIDHGGQQHCRERDVPHARLPNRPVGFSSRIRMKISEMPIWPSCSPRNRPPSDSVMPIRKPPTAAPRKLPMPPSTTMVKATSTKA